MNTIGINGNTQTMDGHVTDSKAIPQKAGKNTPVKDTMILPDSAAEVTANIKKNEANIESTVQDLQKLSDMVPGHKLTFNINKELDKVVVKVVNSSTDEVIREIPSEDLQRIQVRMKQAIGVLFDEMI